MQCIRMLKWCTHIFNVRFTVFECVLNARGEMNNFSDIRTFKLTGKMENENLKAKCDERDAVNDFHHISMCRFQIVNSMRKIERIHNTKHPPRYQMTRKKNSKWNGILFAFHCDYRWFNACSNVSYQVLHRPYNGELLILFESIAYCHTYT